MAIGKFIGGLRFGVSMDTGKLNRDVKKSRGIIKGFVGQTTKLLGVLGGAAGVTAVIGKAAMSFESLNRSMNRSLAIMGNVADSMRKDMKDAAIEVSRVTNASANQSADAYFFLASAGLDAAQSLKALPLVARFAQAGNFDLATATDLLTDAQSALGLTVKNTVANMQNMISVSDVLVKANTLANASVQQFSESLTNKAGAALRLVGKDIEEGVAVLAAYADQGKKGAEAGTGFSIVLRDLQTKAIRFSDEFAKARVRVFDASGEMRNMADIISDLENRMEGLSDKAKKNFLLGLGFSDKSVAFVAMLVGVSDKIREYEKALRSAGGTTAEVADKMLTPLEKSLNNLSASFAELGDTMAPVVNALARIADDAATIVGFFEGKNVGQDESFLGFKTIEGGLADRFNKGFAEAVKGYGLIGPDHPFKPLSKNFLTDTGPRRTKSSSRNAQFKTPESIALFQTKEFLANAPKIGTALVDALTAGIERGQAQQKLAASIFDSLRRGARNVRGSASAALGRANVGLFGLQRNLLLAVSKAERASRGGNKLSPVANQLSFAESGSADSFRQRAAIRNQGERKKLDVARNKTLTDIKDQLVKSPIVLLPANL